MDILTKETPSKSDDRNITESDTAPETIAEVLAPDKKKSFKTIGMQFLKFTAFSLGAGIIELLSFTLLNEISGLDYWVSYFIALALSVIYNFTLNRRFTFKSAANVPAAMLLVLLFYCAFTPYSIWLTDFLAAKNNWNEYLVLFLVMAQNMILEFLWCRFVIYRKNMNTAVSKTKKANNGQPSRKDNK